VKQQTQYIKISPESIRGDIFDVTVSGNTFGVYSGMSQILSGGTMGESLLTGLTVPILFTQTFDDMGFYSGFDGFILQKDIVTNFIFSGDTNFPYAMKVYNTSDELKKFLKLSSYTIDWGDGTIEPFTSLFPNYIEHQYPPIPAQYTITLYQNNPWGNTRIKKTIHTPVEDIEIINPLGNVTFTPQGGNWANIPISYDFIFTGDSENTINAQTYNQTVVLSGFTHSRLTDLKLYGPTKYDTSVTVQKGGQEYGRVTDIGINYTGYTILGVDYYDYPNGTTIFVMNSSGFTQEMLTEGPITKEEVLFGVVNSPEIQSQIFIDRGKNSAFEGLQRLGEVDNMGDLVRYGYGFFKLNEQE